MKKIRIAVLLVVLLVVGYLALGDPLRLTSLNAPKVGETYQAELEYNVARRGEDAEAYETPVELTILGLEDIGVGGTAYIGVRVRVKNLGKRAFSFSHGFAQLRDSQGREFVGMCMKDALGRGRLDLTFLEAQPGLEDEGEVWFKVPNDVADGRVYFGFVSIVDKDEHQARALIIENKAQTTASRGD